MEWIYLYFAAVTAAGFIVMGHDKKRAKAGGRRVPEKRIWQLAIIGGGLGTYFGMMNFRHKTKHLNFRIGLLLLALLDIAVLLWLGIK